MSTHLYVVFSQPVEGQEDEYRDWYDDEHLAAVLEHCGFSAAQRFRVVGDDPGAPGPFMAIYEIDTDDVEAVNAAFMQAVGSGAVRLSPALDLAHTTPLWFEAITERVTR